MVLVVDMRLTTEAFVVKVLLTTVVAVVEVDG